MANTIGFSEFREEQVALAVQAFLMACNAWTGAVLVRSANETRTGADTHFKYSYPMFMQFKRSDWVLNTHPAKTFPIIKDRKALNAPSSVSFPGALYFKLRDRYKPKRGGTPTSQYQHNVLFSLNSMLSKMPKAQIGHAVYVAPLETNASIYNNAVLKECAEMVNRAKVAAGPITASFSRYDLDGTDFSTSTAISFGKSPFIQGHVCFPPHVTVTNAKHYYSFTDKGEDIAFHSPKLVAEGERRLGQWLDTHYAEFQKSKTLFTTEEMQILFRDRFSSEYIIGLPELPDGPDDITYFKPFADYLKSQFDIETLMICANDSEG